MSNRLFWEDMCYRNDHTWILTHNTWRQYWCDPTSTTSMLIDPEKRGFLFYVDNGDNIILYFALVDQCHRGKGVLSAMMKRFEQKFVGRKILLEVIVGVS